MKRKIIRFFRKFVSRMDIELSSKIMYRAFVHKKLNLKNPTSLNEKICWLKLRVFPKDPLVIQCADKYAVRGYIENKGHGDLLVRLAGVWDKVGDIDWESLPSQFVLKCNHGSAYNIICTDKQKLDIVAAKKKLGKWMSEDFGLVSGEPHYSKIPRKIICEEFLEGEMKDYKFYCFNGIPRFYYVAEVPNGDFHNMICEFIMPDGTPADFYRLDHKRFDTPPVPPDNLDEMMRIASELSSDIPFVRVDLMNVEGRLYFSELTFTPSAGFMPMAPEGADEQLGDLLDLEQYRGK